MNIHILTVPRSEIRPECDGADWYFQTKFYCPKCGNAHVEPGLMQESMDSVCTKCDPHQGMNRIHELIVKICPMANWREEAILGVHEATEALICRANGVSQRDVDEYDQRYDREHPDQPDLNAGDETDAPYRLEHCFATAIERILAGALNVPWKEYDDRLSKTYPGPSKRETT